MPNNRHSAPCSSREETISSIESLVTGESDTPLCQVYGEGPLLISDIPSNCTGKNINVNVGIDEAGRGPILGPMVYSAAYWSPPQPNDSELSKLEKLFRDSKTLTPSTRYSLFQQIKSCQNIGFVVRVIHASEISRKMLRKSSTRINLNEMSHDGVIEMIRSILDAGVNINTCYVDTVGNPATYRNKLEKVFSSSSVRFVVEKKADSKYATCSAASVVAKVVRDQIVENWTWNADRKCPSASHYEKILSKDFGSGYPSDPKCKKWMENNLVDQVFGYPDVVRFSWAPAKFMLKEKAALVEWEADEEDIDECQMSMKAFCARASDGMGKNDNLSRNKKRRRVDFFEKIGMTVVSQITPM